ncbi:MAG: terpene synthase family protein [Gammaproteobacteria bacterium]
MAKQKQLKKKGAGALGAHTDLAIPNLKLPSIHCPFPSAVSPYAEAVDQHTLAWAERHALVTGARALERLRAFKSGWLAARAYPYAPLNRLAIVSDWNTWLFMLDDQCDEHGIGKRPERLTALHAKCLHVLAGGRPEPQDRVTAQFPQRERRADKCIDLPLLHALDDLRERLQAIVAPDWMARFIQRVSEYFESSVWEAENRAHGLWPEPATYTRMRPYTGAVYTVIELIEAAEGIALPLAVRKHPRVQRLALITSNVVCWSNDTISLKKEHAHHDTHNLALIFQRHYGLTIQEAVDRVAKLTEAQMRQFIALESRMPVFGAGLDAVVRRFVAGLRAWMRGNLDWSYDSGRYGQADRAPARHAGA